jgi:hypothetical protein
VLCFERVHWHLLLPQRLKKKKKTSHHRKRRRRSGKLEKKFVGVNLIGLVGQTKRKQKENKK